jgi:hypothetical protein
MTKKNFPKLSEFISEHYSKDEAADIRADAQEEFAQLQALQEDVTRIIAQYMAREKIGFNEMVRRLGISPSQFSRIERGDGNIDKKRFNLVVLEKIAQSQQTKFHPV